MEHDIYRSLQEKISQYGSGFPASKSGVELKMLKKLFSEADAELYMKLAPQPETAEMIADRIGDTADKTAEHLKHMLKNGTVICFEKEGRIVYFPAPYIPGIYENMGQIVDAELAELLEQYHNEAYFEHLANTVQHIANATKNPVLKYIPVQEAIKSFSKVFPPDDAIALLKSKKKIAVVDCICRKQLKLTGVPTNLIECCFFFDDYADYFVDKRKQGRYLSIDEAIEIQMQCEKAGLVSTGGVTKDEILMCHCDKQCVAFRSLKNRITKDLIRSNYYAQVNMDSCSGCGACVERCVTDAVSINNDGIAEVNLGRCIGCGQCATVCPTGAIFLEQKPEEEQYKELLSAEEFAKRMMSKKTSG